MKKQSAILVFPAGTQFAADGTSALDAAFRAQRDRDEWNPIPWLTANPGDPFAGVKENLTARGYQYVNISSADGGPNARERIGWSIRGRTTAPTTEPVIRTNIEQSLINTPLRQNRILRFITDFTPGYKGREIAPTQYVMPNQDRSFLDDVKSGLRGLNAASQIVTDLARALNVSESTALLILIGGGVLLAVRLFR
jgi:hypothetical protein